MYPIPKPIHPWFSKYRSLVSSRWKRSNTTTKTDLNSDPISRLHPYAASPGIEHRAKKTAHHLHNSLNNKMEINSTPRSVICAHPSRAETTVQGIDKHQSSGDRVKSFGVIVATAKAAALPRHRSTTIETGGSALSFKLTMISHHRSFSCIERIGRRWKTFVFFCALR